MTTFSAAERQLFDKSKTPADRIQGLSYTDFPSLLSPWPSKSAILDCFETCRKSLKPGEDMPNPIMMLFALRFGLNFAKMNWREWTDNADMRGEIAKKLNNSNVDSVRLLFEFQRHVQCPEMSALLR